MRGALTSVELVIIAGSVAKNPQTLVSPLALGFFARAPPQHLGAGKIFATEPVKYLNNVVEADHGKLKQLIRPVRGFKTLKTAYATIMGFEVMRALRKGQAAIFNLTQDIRGEAHLVERAFGLGVGALAEAVAMIGERLEIQPA